MTLPTGTVETFAPGTLSARVLRHLVDQHNQGVIDDHVVTAKLDGDGGVTDTDYEDQLTASEIEYDGYSPTEDSVIGHGGPFTDPGQYIGEPLMKALVEELANRVTDQSVIATKLDADAGVDFTTYGRAAGQVPHQIIQFDDPEGDIPGVLERVSNGDIFLELHSGGESVWRSRDDGRTWHRLGSVDGVDIHGSCFLETSPGQYIFIDEDECFRSWDDGQTWERFVPTVPAGTSGIFAKGVVVDAATYIIGGIGLAEASLLITHDYGQTWEATSIQVNAELNGRPMVKTADGTIIAASYGGEVNLHRSTDGGATWSVVHSNTDMSSLAGYAGLVTAAGTILIAPRAEAGIANVVFRSVDDGANWTEPTTGPTAADQLCLGQGPSGRIYLWEDTPQLRFSDDDGATWAATNVDRTPTNANRADAFVTTRNGDVLISYADTTDGASIHRIFDHEPLIVEALGSSVTGDNPLSFPGEGGGIHGKLLDALVRQHNRLAGVWHSVCAELDEDTGVTDVDYEDQLEQSVITFGARSGFTLPMRQTARV